MRGRVGRRAVKEEAPVPAVVQQPILPVSSDLNMMDVSMEGTELDMDGAGEKETRKRKPWEKPDGVKAKKKKVPGAKNLKIRKFVQPKNAVMCLNELRPGVVYNTEQEGGVSQPFCVSVEVDGQKYRGFGTSKQLAKQASAEAALISFVKPPIPAGAAPAAAADASANGNETTAAPATTGPPEDKTPWATLASFAIYKLFNDWRDGRVGMCPPPTNQAFVAPPGFTSFLASAEKDEVANAQAFTEAITAHLGGRTPQGVVSASGTGVLEAKDINQYQQELNSAISGDAKVPKPAKQIPENAAGMHPVMVLHQMKPGLQYTISQENKDGKGFFTIGCDIDGQHFVGEGPNVKKAKFNLAKTAISELYAIESFFEPQSA